MRIKVINPNTSDEMTRSIHQVATAYASLGTEIVTTHPTVGPVSIESFYDEYQAIPQVLAEIKRNEEDFDAFVLACWGDPGTDAVREMVPQPVVGIAEASMYAANAIAPRWSVVTTLRRSHHMVEAVVKKTGLAEHCASVRCIDLPVLACEEDSDAVIAGLVQVGRQALEIDGAEAIILGCAGMGGMAAYISQQLSVPCVDPVGAGVRFAELLVALRLQTSKYMTYRPPEAKLFH
ncbi:MAG TPA: aspartate/glutamate racemase family protein [Synechococcales cyanobacterium M55_K2018_004]|nr:aspartate/glutamate racemase family protein [Synechococcales cyanobacterium M55_K2018_004]